MNQPDHDNNRSAIAHLYPDLTESERQKAFENLDRYIDLSLRMYERIRNDPQAYERFKALMRKRRQERGEQIE